MLYIGIFAAIASVYLFTEYNRVQKAKREERREQINERRQELLDKAIKRSSENDDE